MRPVADRPDRTEGDRHFLNHHHGGEIDPASGLPIRQAVTGFVYREGKVLVLKRAADMRRFPGLWAGCSGIIDPGESPEEAMVRELLEETRLTLVKMVMGQPLRAPGRQVCWDLTPFRITATGQVVLDGENDDWQWVEPAGLGDLESVPDLVELWNRVAGLASAHPR